ncbi:unnamed protein product [Echinostoma caproni]|uniref:Transferase n=1 Tax=Echinostoma caproni TaxID=27848 RepID=A0A183AL28_9TREM|nr:unnamed protein product [Echinostoma caproni]
MYCIRLLQITIPFRSALSFTALFKPSPIYLKLEIDQDTGYLFYNKTFYQDTVISRIRRLWSDIRASRMAFDATPSKGMLDKAAARPLHRIWSYVFRGFLASVLLLLFWPPVCLIVSSLSLLVGLTLPIIVPFASLTSHLLGLLFWDAYKPGSSGGHPSDSYGAARTVRIAVVASPDGINGRKAPRCIQLALRMGAELTECFYRNRIVTRLQILNQNPSTWWSTFSLTNEDFLGESAPFLKTAFSMCRSLL